MFCSCFTENPTKSLLERLWAVIDVVEVYNDEYTGEVNTSPKQIFEAESYSRVWDNGPPVTNRKRYHHNNYYSGAKNAKHDAELSALLFEISMEVLI